MNLPELPKVRRKKEAADGLKLRALLKDMRSSFVFELKHATNDSLPFAAVKEHQIAALMQVKYKSLLFKPLDNGRQKLPFDYFYMTNLPAFVVIKYRLGFEFIDVDTFVLESKRSKVRSLTYGRARSISTFSFSL